MMHKLSHFKLPLLLSSIVLGCLLFGEFIPESIKAVLYGVSLSIKELLIFILPFIIFSFVFSAMTQMAKGAIRFIVTLVSLVCLSNFISTHLAYFLGYPLIENLDLGLSLSHTREALQPWISLSLPRILSNDIALFSGFIVGLLGTFLSAERSQRVASKLMNVAMTFLNKGFIPIMPLFILGFSLKLEHDEILTTILKDYSLIFVIIAGLVFSYITLLYGFSTLFRPQRWLKAMKNMFPPMLTGFSTMSSASALPLILLAGEKNTGDPAVSRAVIPATVNIHLIGDCFAIPIFALAISLSFTHTLPGYEQYLIFACYFVLAKFAVSAVPGGGILVMLPILEQYLGFNAEMLSLITALYIMFDSVITSANVMGNGSFVMVFTKIFRGLDQVQSPPQKSVEGA